MFEGNERKQREHEMKEAGRLPPGQALTLKWPVLHYGSVPRFDPATWDFKVTGLVEVPRKLTWDEFNRLPRMTVRTASQSSEPRTPLLSTASASATAQHAAR